MGESTAQDSTKFPPGYGDFALHCSDDVICHFPRYLLGYMSGFFKGMFELPDISGTNEQSRTTPEPLRLTETSVVIELLLQHIDPRTQHQEINPDNIVDLLEAARKYQVPTITESYENEVQLKRTLVYTASIPDQHVSLASQPLLVTNPLLVLYCALRFDLPRSGQLALKEFTQCNAGVLEFTTHPISLQAYLHGMSLRRERIELFRGFIAKLTKLKEVRGHRYNEIITNIDLDTKTCAKCTSARASWIFTLEAAVRQTPTWASFVTAYEASGKTCTRCATSSWADYYRQLLKDWEVKAKEMERELPAWPY
jgi:hypothetical protein